MPKYDLIEYSDNYSKTSASLYQYCRDEPALGKNDFIIDFTNNDTFKPLKFKEKTRN